MIRQMRAWTLLVGMSLVYSANAASAEPAKDEGTKKVLSFSSYEPASPGGTIVTERCSAILRKGSTVPVRVYHEFLDSSRREDIAPQTKPNVTMFDWRELRRWRISESRLPAGSIVEFINGPSFWDHYKWYIVAIICLGGIEALLVAGLLIHRARRRQAEKESHRLAQLAEAERRQRDEVISNMPGVVWERSSDHANDTQKIVVISQHIEKLLGYSVEEWLSNPDFMESIIHDEDREGFTRLCDEILAGRPEANLQFRWRAKDGRVLWAEAYLYPILEEDAVTGLRGVALDITNRKRAEDELRQSEERLRLAQRAARVGTWDWNLITGESKWSEGIYKLLGLEPGDGNARVEDFVGFIHPQDRDRVLRNVESMIRNSEMYHDEFRIIRRDGGILWLASKGNAVRGDTGRAERMIGVNIDITDRKLAEEAVRQMEQRNQDIIRALPDLMFVQTADGVFLDYNASDTLDLLVPPEEFLGKNMRDVLPEELAERLFVCFQRAKESGELQIIEYALPIGGEPHWYEARIIHTNTGHFLSIVRNVTERKRAEEAVKQAFVQVSEVKWQLEAENIYLQEEIRLEQSFNEIIGESEAIRQVFLKIERAAQTNITVLILGETGTGKELAARAIHKASHRKDKPLIKVNCTALPATLIESELFGHEKGAFTSATARQLGRFELANDGTIFLDEIGDLPPELQGKLLRVLEEGEFERLGSGKTIKVDVRVIAATNRDLQTEIKKGRFREDLWYRLNAFPVTMPPLRERKEDVPLLVEAFVRKHSKELGKTIKAITPATMRALRDYSWPGNVRELANVIERALINTEGEILSFADQFNPPQTVEFPFARQTLEDMERQYILRVLEETKGRIEGPKGAARVLGLNPSTLRTRMAKLGIRKSQDESRLEPPAEYGKTSN